MRARWNSIPGLCFCLLICASMLGAQPGDNRSKEKATADACALLTWAEVESVQGQRVIGAKPSRQQNSNFVISQCYYSVNPSAESVAVSLAVPEPTTAARSGPKDFWSLNFHSSKKEKELEGDAEEEGKDKSIEPVQLGDESYWVRNRFGGSLYVLKGDAFFVISLGGKQDEAARINKARALAKDALKKLR